MPQQKEQKIQLVDKNGRAFDEEKLQSDTREQIIQNIFSYFIRNEEEQTDFINAAVQYLPADQITVKDNQIALDLSSSALQDFTLLYATQKVMDQALDENLLDAYLLLAELTGAQKYRKQEMLALTEDDFKELKDYYAPTPELQLAQEICNIQMQINQAMNGQSDKYFTSFQANRIQELYEEMMPYLNFEQRAAAYYNVSLIHRALLPEKDYYDPAENNSEKECLKKVLEYTVDHKRIHYCLNRLGSSFKDQGMLRAAYRRALSAAASDSDLYKINLALAECYVADYHPKIGFRYDNHPEHEHEDQKLARAELYYQAALEHAPDPEKLNILKRIAKLQKQQSKTDAWTATQTTLAMEYMKGEERCHMLLNIAEHNSTLRVPYLERVVYEASRSREMSPKQKLLAIQKAAASLKPVYMSEHNQGALDKLETSLQKYAKHAELPQNPLAKYKTKSSTR